MQNILTIALGTIFPKENIQSIMEVISATPNPDIATEILLGIYQEPAVCESVMIDGKQCFFISYNKWDDQVKYYYITKESKHIYVKKDTDTSLINESNYEEFAVKYSESVIGHRVTLSNDIRIENHTYLSTWNSKPMAVVVSCNG
jgi:hypothetical protein